MLRKWLIITMLILYCALAQAQELIENPTVLKSITERWDLERGNRKGTFQLTSYRPIYVTASRWSNNPNTLPQSENPDYSLTEEKNFSNFEAKFQLSFKTKIIQSLFEKMDMWIGYTQKAHWQLYNIDISRAFRELNYEPELIFTLPVNLEIGGLTLKMLSTTFNHQSNGRDLPRSRSWNRIMFDVALESKNLQLYIRPWIRLNDDDDENPLITSYIGNGSVTAIYRLQKHSFYVIGTNTFTFKDNRGSLEVNYLYPINRDLNFQAQFFTGYGETLVDYNHCQTTVGLGVSFVNW